MGESICEELGVKAHLTARNVAVYERRTDPSERTLVYCGMCVCLCVEGSFKHTPLQTHTDFITTQ